MIEKSIVNVLLITYNQERFVGKAIESVLMQVVDEQTSVTLVVADDCSTDNTLGVIKSYEEKSPFPFVYLSRDQNVGISRNYQLAIEACDGDYVAVLEGDDYWLDCMRLKKHLDYLNSHKECVMTVNSRLEYDQKKELFITTDCLKNYCFSLLDTIKDYDFIRNLSAVVFRKKRLDQMNSQLFEVANHFGGICVDRFMVHDVLQRGYGFHFRDVMSVYRIHTGKNASFVHFTNASIEEKIDYHKRFSDEANSLLNVDCSSAFQTLFETRENELKELELYLKKTKLCRFIPPILVDLFFFTPRLRAFIKKCVRALIPNGLYSTMKSIKAKLNKK